MGALQLARRCLAAPSCAHLEKCCATPETAATQAAPMAERLWRMLEATKLFRQKTFQAFDEGRRLQPALAQQAAVLRERLVALQRPPPRRPVDERAAPLPAATAVFRRGGA